MATNNKIRLTVTGRSALPIQATRLIKMTDGAGRVYWSNGVVAVAADLADPDTANCDVFEMDLDVAKLYDYKTLHYVKYRRETEFGEGKTAVKAAQYASEWNPIKGRVERTVYVNPRAAKYLERRLPAGYKWYGGTNPRNKTPVLAAFTATRQKTSGRWLS